MGLQLITVGYYLESTNTRGIKEVEKVIIEENSTPRFTTCVLWLALYWNTTFLREDYD